MADSRSARRHALGRAGQPLGQVQAIDLAHEVLAGEDAIADHRSHAAGQ